MASNSSEKSGQDSVIKPRRSHRKSRNGCRVCKARHMKCDETRPACINCSVAGRQCEYKSVAASRPKIPNKSDGFLAPSPVSQASNPSPASVATSASSPSHHQQHPEYNGPPIPVPDGPNLFTLEHLAFFHHAQYYFNSELMADGSSAYTAATVIEYGLQAPYLMNELLAVAALHLGHLNPGRLDYQQHATALQTRALSSFNDAKEDVSPTTCVPMFIFSSLLGLHVLHDTLRNRPDNFSVFLDQFMGYIGLHRGVSTVTNRSWSIIKESKLNPIISHIEDAYSSGDDGAEEVNILYDMVSESHLNEASVETYHQSIRTLRRTLNLHRSLTEKCLQPSEGPATFCITVNEEYIEYLKQRRPEALVILAFYATMLHWSRNFWVFGDGGQYLIQAITAYLGSHWERWLAWPNSVLQSGSLT
ncbi:hypothetical protein B0J13DRAFT_513515 [Dactylonectria estremocensis]|uniref:Zn(2)-C6 fungal-type domain-containing protein n=1 Tax=Dactylonectria estremocensis TaxID=1079267 RepID=A0A9P9IG85_9HYPO|nr:hypothetical protein B0J13DRAFT_513515 [Dactylonectria estremocensis]